VFLFLTVHFYARGPSDPNKINAISLSVGVIHGSDFTVILGNDFTLG
jgi:hypothetical protein